MPESDPKALLQQKIPKSFQDMDDKLSSVVQNLKQDGHDLIMDRKDFVATFMELFGDEDELMEAVYFHKLQGLSFIWDAVADSVWLNILVLAGPVQIAQLCHLYSVENLLEHNT